MVIFAFVLRVFVIMLSVCLVSTARHGTARFEHAEEETACRCRGYLRVYGLSTSV
jgi:hypothetical protein